MDRASRGAVGSGNIRRTSRVNPVAEAAQAVGRASTIFNRAVVVGAQRRLDVALDLADSLRLSLSNLGGTNAINSVLEVAHHEVAAELLDVVTQTSAVGKLVREDGDIATLGNTRGLGGREAVNGPLHEGSGRLGLSSGRKNRSLLGGEDRQDIEKVFAVGNRGTRIGRIVGIRKSHCSSSLLAFRELCCTKGDEVAYAT